MITVHLLTSPSLSSAMHRVDRALCMYAPPSVTFVRREQAELTVIPAVGHESIEVASLLRSQGRHYVIIQYCLRTTHRPGCADWLDTWKSARLVWSYYDLPALCREDEVDANFNFYRSPLGVDSEVFSDYPRTARPYALFSSGYVAQSECVLEAVGATAALGLKQFHLGPNMGFPSHVTHRMGISDSQLASVYRSCQFVLGLRRIEGFELPAAEGLLCGAQPVMFDRPHYRAWFEPWAKFIHEDEPAAVVNALKELILRGPKPVTPDERAVAVSQFSWRYIAQGFWDRVLA